MIAVYQLTVPKAKISVPSAARRGPTPTSSRRSQQSAAFTPATAMLNTFMLNAVPHHHTNGTRRIAGVGPKGEWTLPFAVIQSW